LTLRERRTLELARALTGAPQLLLLDEVMAGLNPAELERFVAVVRGAIDQLTVSVVWVEHVMRAVTTLADRVLVLHLGRRLAEGEPGAVMRDPAVVEAYLGQGAEPHAQG
ncbi:MAG: ABC transporter ATP-binding protein, partial [Actinomycetota bacterium]